MLTAFGKRVALDVREMEVFGDDVRYPVEIFCMEALHMDLGSDLLYPAAIAPFSAFFTYYSKNLLPS
jgi:hypothetical protein